MLDFHSYILKGSFPGKALIHTKWCKPIGSSLIGAGAISLLLLYKHVPGTFLSLPWTNIFTSKDSDFSPDPEELMIPGLHNLKNNCFLNVVLQALASSEIFCSFMYDIVQMRDICSEDGDDAMPLADVLLKLIEELSMLGPKRKVVNPRKLIWVLQEYAANFDLSNQQDAAEALEQLISALRDECMLEFEAYMLQNESIATALAMPSYKVLKHKEKWHGELLQKWNCHLRGPLVGTLGSVLSCKSCMFQYPTQYDFFYNLPVPIASSNLNGIIMQCALEDCLTRFTAPESIPDYRCSHCSHLFVIKRLSQNMVDKQFIHKIEDCKDDENCSCISLLAQHGLALPAIYRNVSKQIQIGNCPEVLCLNIQRGFVNHAGELIKLKGHVKFPLVLDLFPYTVMENDQKKSFLHHHIHSSSVKNPSWMSYMTEYEKQNIKFDSSMLSNTCKKSYCHDGSSSGNDFNASEQTSKDDGHGLASSVAVNKMDDIGNDNVQKNSLTDEAPSYQVQKSDATLQAFEKKSRSPNTEPIDDNKSRFKVDINGCGSTGNKGKLPYELISVVEHHGTFQDGHYTVYRKLKLSKEQPLQKGYEKNERNAQSRVINDHFQQSKPQILWFRISDSDVQRVPEEYVLQAEASLLFYEKLRI